MDALANEGLPPGWGTAPLETISDINPATDISALTSETAITFVPMAAVGALTNTVDTSTTRPLREITTGFTRFQSGDVIFAKITPCMENGKIALVPEIPHGIGIGSTEFHVIRPKPGMDPAFVCHYLMQESFRATARRSMSGAVGQQRVPAAFLREALIPVAPTAEQTRIVAAVNALFEEVEAGEAALARSRAGLTQFRASLLHAACTGVLTADWRTANPTNQTAADLLAEVAAWRAARGLKPLATASAVDAATLPTLPEGWIWASLPQLGEFGRGKSKHRPRDDARLYGAAMPFIQTGEVSRSRGRITSWSRMYSDFGVAQSKVWPAGTVCITIAANIAASGILTFDACFPDSVVGLVTPHAALARYVELFMQTARANLDTYAPATAQKNINLEILNTVAVPLPPLMEIKAIVRAVDDVQTEAVEPVGTIADGSALRQSILHAAFTGRLVPQDPADEPAAALLARLRAAPAAARRPRARRTATQPDLIETPA
jgi:type I restriction enzyme S subunit